MWNCNNPYADRDENLKRLGFKSYRQYIESPFWAGIRDRALKRAQGLCERCGSGRSIQVHHRSYDLATLAGTSIDSLTVVCRSCHCEAERPTDFTRTRYERLIESSETVLQASSKRKWEHACARWYERWSAWLPQKLDRASQARLAAAIRQRVAQGWTGCILCGRPNCNPRSDPKVMTDGRTLLRFCGHHNWRAVTACREALDLGGQYTIDVVRWTRVPSTSAATDGKTATASGPQNSGISSDAA